MTPTAGGLRVLAVDDEQPAREEIAFLLRQDPRVAAVRTAASADEALRLLREGGIDAVFLDIQLPGLNGLELAQVLGQFKQPPPIVFVTAHDAHAVEAFDLRAVDFVLKPIRTDRLTEAIRRLVDGADSAAVADVQVPVERAGVTRFIARSAITHVEAQGDYARLHTREDSFLVRTPLASLEAEWAEAGFVRIHRSSLVSLAHIEEVRMDAGRCTVIVGANELQVARRHTRELRDLLMRRAGSS